MGNLLVLSPEISQFAELIKDWLDADFAKAALVTFFACEGIFRTGWIKNDGVKVILAVAVGGLWGLMLFPMVASAAIAKGMTAGGAAALYVAKFKAPTKKPADKPAA